jgi:hypothetical protein
MTPLFLILAASKRRIEISASMINRPSECRGAVTNWPITTTRSSARLSQLPPSGDTAKDSGSVLKSAHRMAGSLPSPAWRSFHVLEIKPPGVRRRDSRIARSMSHSGPEMAADSILGSAGHGVRAIGGRAASEGERDVQAIFWRQTRPPSCRHASLTASL